MNKMDGKSKDLLKENIKQLKQLFPEVCCEDKIDFEKLKQVLGEYVEDDKERYNFTWNRKGHSLRLSQTPSLGTLRPCKEDSKDWDSTQNLYIEGDNLEVLKLLQKSYYGKVKMIYIDPPYNTGNDFVYPDDFSKSIESYKEITGQLDEEHISLTTNSESAGRYHTDWLNMMYPRLRLARGLLSNDGVIFISIDDNEIDNLKKICGEVLGENNFIAAINWKGRGGRQDSKYFAAVHEYILCYAKNKDFFVAGEEIKSDDIYPKYDQERNRYYKTQLLRKWGSNSRREDRPNLYYPIKAPDGTDVYPFFREKDSPQSLKSGKLEGCWRHGETTMKKNIDEGKVEFAKDNDGEWIAYEKIFAPGEGKEKTKKYTTWIDDSNDGSKFIKNIFGAAVFDYPKSVNLIKRFLKMSNVKEHDIALDFFSGSATTAHAVMQLNAEDGGDRRFIMVQLPEVCGEKTEAYKAGYNNICEIGKERIRRAGEKIKAEIEEENVQLKIGEEPKKVPDIGFRVFKLDSSNLKKWQPDYDNLEKTLLDSIENYEEGRSELDVVYEIILKMGLDLTYPVDELNVNGRTIYSVAFGALMICLDDHITKEIADGMISLYQEYQPELWKVVFKDNGFEDDSAKTNIKEQLKAAGLEEDAFTTI